MPGAVCARSLVREMKKHTSIVTTVTPDIPGISRTNGFTVSFVVSPETGLYCLRHPREALASQELDTSVGVSGRYDFAVRINALRHGHVRVHRIPLRVRDDREPPLLVERDSPTLLVIWGNDQRLMAATNWHDGQISFLYPQLRRKKSRSPSLKLRLSLFHVSLPALAEIFRVHAGGAVVTRHASGVVM
jgi:hypothetical protein